MLEGLVKGADAANATELTGISQADEEHLYLSMERLRDNLMKDYKKDVGPTPTNGRSITISLAMSVSNLELVIGCWNRYQFSWLVIQWALIWQDDKLSTFTVQSWLTKASFWIV